MIAMANESLNELALDSRVISAEDARRYIAQLDLSYIVDAMCSPQYPLPRWTRSDASHCCKLYKNFLYLFKKHLPISLVPTREIDEFWHNHILYTQNYFRDCANIFGHYLHHEPASPVDNPQKLSHDFQMTKQLYFEEFNQPLVLGQANVISGQP
jgi:hypothetical protein